MNIKLFTSILLVAIVCTNVVVDATHFRYGAITWEPISTSSYNTIKFRIDLAFRKTYFSSVVTGGTITHSTFNFGNGDSTSVKMNVTSVNDAEDWFTGTFITQYTYKNNGNFTAYYYDCCRISTLENNADANWNVSTSVLIKPAANQAGGVLNTSPVVGGQPIVQVTAQVENKYTIVAVDAEQSVLSYSLSTIWGSGLTQPSGLTLSGNVITFTPGSVDTGKDYELYCTQIVVSDGISYTVVDFIFKAVRPISGVCDPSCSNDATPCSTGSNCKNCNSTLGSNTCLPKQPPVFIVPTPDANSITPFQIGLNQSYTIAAKSPYKSLSVSISPANPKGSSLLGVTGSNPSQIIYNWNPTVNDAGSYVVSASIQDSQGTVATEGARSFILFVTKPTCGHGNDTNGVCVCDKGWNATSNCFDCENGYYGPNCQPSDDCNGNGQSNDGTSGDGTCKCYLGYQGKNCDIKVTQFCEPTNPSYISDTSTTVGFLQPSSLTAVISTFSTTAPLTLNLSLAIPSKNPITNILAVFDVNVASNPLLGAMKTEAQSFEDGVTALNEGSQFAFGTFSDASSGSYNYQSKFIMGTQASTAIKSLFANAPTQSSSTGNSLLALNNAVQSSVAWQAGAFRIVILFTDSDFSTSTNSSNVQTELVSKLISNSIYPVIVGTSDSLPNWVSFMNSTGNLGLVKVSSGGSDWRKKAVEGISTSYSIAIPKKSEDIGGFVATTPAPFSVKSGIYNVIFTLKYPTSAPPTRPTVSLSVLGFGKVSISINYNHPPVAQPYQLGLDEDTPKNFSLVVTDIDSNLIRVSFPSISTFSAYGVITYGGNNIVANTFYDISAISYFSFVPAANAFGSFSIPFTATDGCATSSSTISVNINEINDPTTCSSLSAKTVSVNTPATFVLSGVDVDDVVLVVLSTFADLAAAGTLKTSNVDAIAGKQYANGQTFTYTQTDNSVTGTKTLSFTVSDGRGSSMTCSVPITLTHINMPPSVTAATPISGVPTIETQVNLQITDSDSPSGTLLFNTLTTTDGAQFYICGAPSNLLTASSTISFTLTKQQTVVSICVKSTIQTATSNYGNIKFYAKDNENAQSSSFTVVVNLIGSRPNQPPVVNQIPNFSFEQGSPAPSVSITGSDPNQPQFDNTLTAIITQQPINGKFVLTSSPTTTASSSATAPFAITYVPNADFFGTDSFSYTISDELGLRASTLTTNITVVYKDYPPVLNIAPYVFNQNTPVTAQSLSVSDVDILKVNDVVKCTITSLPSNFIMKQSNNAVISTVPTLLVDQTAYSYFITVAPNTYQSLTGQFTASCTDTFDNTVSATGQITFNYINVPPTAADSSVSTDQNVPKTFVFNIADLEDPTHVKVKFLSIPVNGKIVCDGTQATINSILTVGTCIYTPNDGLSNWNTLGHLGPLDTISFVSVDSASASSLTTASVKFYVNPMNPPVFLGNSHLTTLEDTSLPVIINGRPGDGGSSYSVSINRIVGNGTFFVSYCMGNEGCLNKPITSFPTTSEAASLYNYYFTPNANENGVDYMIVYFTLYETTSEYTLTSKELSITIDVIPVNDPPTIQLIESQVVGTDTVVPIPSSGVVSIPMNESVILTYTGDDIDSDINKLVSLILAPPLRGNLYVYDASASDFLGYPINRTSNVIARTATNWKLVFVPDKDSSGTGYAKIPVVIRDYELALSSSATISIDVDPINVPPVIFTNKVNYSVQVGNAVSITEVSFDDPDSTYNNVSLTLTVLKEDGKTISTESVIVLSGEYKSVCQSSNGVVECIGNKVLLNSFLTTITLNETSGNYVLRVLVDDLGYNAALSKRDENHLTATANLTVEVTPLDAGTKKTSNKTVLSAAIAGAAVAAGVIAAGVWKLIKKAAPPTDAFFGENPFADGAISDNPLYAESANSGINPLYESTNA